MRVIKALMRDGDKLWSAVTIGRWRTRYEKNKWSYAPIGLLYAFESPDATEASVHRVNLDPLELWVCEAEQPSTPLTIAEMTGLIGEAYRTRDIERFWAGELSQDYIITPIHGTIAAPAMMPLEHVGESNQGFVNWYDNLSRWWK